MSLSTKKHRVFVEMFDGLAGLGRGKTESGEFVHLNSKNTITLGRFRGLNVGETITCDLESREDGTFFARNIEREPRKETAPIKMHLIEDDDMLNKPVSKL